MIDRAGWQLRESQRDIGLNMLKAEGFFAQRRRVSVQRVRYRSPHKRSRSVSNFAQYGGPCFGGSQSARSQVYRPTRMEVSIRGAVT